MFGQRFGDAREEVVACARDRRIRAPPIVFGRHAHAVDERVIEACGRRKVHRTMPHEQRTVRLRAPCEYRHRALRIHLHKVNAGVGERFAPLPPEPFAAGPGPAFAIHTHVP